MSCVRVLVADDNELVRYALRTLLAAETDIELVAEATDAPSAVAACREAHPDVLVLHLSGHDDIWSVCRDITSTCTDTAVLVISDCSDETEAVSAMHAGACGYLLESEQPEHIVHAVRSIADGQMVLGAGVAEHLVVAQQPTSASADGPVLSARELEVLRLMSQGQSNREIAHSLWIGETTVKTHVSHILRKLGVPDRTGAVLEGVKTGLVRLNG